jgi:formate hydrogenlyase subunit 6/NADH:ubiquinone oxidoreductase subunit I
MRGISKIREQGYKDPLLVQVMKQHGFDELPLYKHRPPEQNALRQRWSDLAKFRDGPVNPQRTRFDDAAAASAAIKAFAFDIGASDVGIARLTPIMVRENFDIPHDYAICMIFAEDYAEALKGPRAIETEAAAAYLRCAENSTKLAEYVRSLGYPAIAHHNGACDIQAIPAMIAAGLGELGKHGSLVHREFGASHRPGIVTTTMPLAVDQTFEFGVQDTCLHCNLCSNNCPADAIPQEFEISEGIRRWVTDVAKCYVYSRLRPEYCHICVDVCPYVHMATGDPTKKDLYKRYMGVRKKQGYKTPTHFSQHASRTENKASART